MDKGLITFKGSNKATSTMRFEGVADLATLVTLNGVLSGKSDCAVSRQAYQDSNIIVVDGSGNVDIKAIITAQDSEGHVHKWGLPGYNGATEIDNEGEKVTDAELTDLLSAIETATGLTLAPLRSPVIQTT